MHHHASRGYGFGFCHFYWKWYKYYDYANMCIFIIIPLILIIYIHTRIILRVKRPEKILRENYSHHNFEAKLVVVKNFKEKFYNLVSNDDHLIKIKSVVFVKIPLNKKNPRKKTVTLLILIVFCFILNNLQYVVNFIDGKLSHSHISTGKIMSIIISQILYFSNSSLNCFLYAFYSKKFCQCAKIKFPYLAKMIDKIKFFLIPYIILFISCLFLGIIYIFIFTPVLE